MTSRLLAAAALMLTPTALMAQNMPPADSMPLSEIVAKLEADLGADLAFIDEIDWDDDGYYEIEYYTADNRQVEIKVDPVSGELRR